MEGLGTYRNGQRYYITYMDFEGEIILGQGDHGGEIYTYVSHIEWESKEEPSEELTEILECHLDFNLTELVLNAESI